MLPVPPPLPVDDDVDGGAEEELPFCGEPELPWCSRTTVAAPAPAPMMASAATAAFQPMPDRRRRDGAYSAPDHGGVLGACCDDWPDQPAGP